MPTKSSLLSRSIAAAGLLAIVLPAAASGIVSSPSESVEHSFGSVSDSIGHSSESSSHTVGLADGDYRITQVAVVDDRPTTTRLTLIAVADDADERDKAEAVFLYVPTRTVDRHALAAQGRITARQRTYGIEFSTTQDKQPFYLLVNDDVQRELSHHIVAL